MGRRRLAALVVFAVAGVGDGFSVRDSLLRLRATLGATTEKVYEPTFVARPPPEVFGPLDGSPITQLEPLAFDPPASPAPLGEAAVAIEDAAVEDLGECAALLVASFFEAASRHPAFLAVTAHREHKRLRAHHGGEAHAQLVARSARLGGEAVAYVDVDCRPKRNPGPGESHPRPYISDLAVRPDHRRRSLATRLVQRCEAAVLDWGYDVVYLKVEASNTAARRMYANLGYDLIHTDDSAKARCTLMKTLR
jgi:ribosomal protein S18 acetylase RimI-like enzyme